MYLHWYKRKWFANYNCTVSAFENITPMGPSRNNIFAFRLPQVPCGQFMDYDVSYNPYGLDSMASVNSVRMDG
jgi:hypothetical protein